MRTQIVEIMSGIFGIPVEQIPPNPQIGAIEGWDSLNHLNMMTCIEQHFKVTFSESEILSVEDLNTLLELLSRKGIQS